MSADFEVAPVCLDTPAELPDLADRIEHTAPADLAVSPPVPVDWKAVANEYRDLADFFKAQAYQTAAQLAQARQEVHQFRHRLMAAGFVGGGRPRLTAFSVRLADTVRTEALSPSNRCVESYFFESFFLLSRWRRASRFTSHSR